jgi:hypothetical protein
MDIPQDALSKIKEKVERRKELQSMQPRTLVRGFMIVLEM